MELWQQFRVTPFSIKDHDNLTKKCSNRVVNENPAVSKLLSTLTQIKSPTFIGISPLLTFPSVTWLKFINFHQLSSHFCHLTFIFRSPPWQVNFSYWDLRLPSIAFLLQNSLRIIKRVTTSTNENFGKNSTN